MKKIKIVIPFILLTVFLFFCYFFLNDWVLQSFYSDYFSIDYSHNFKVLSKSNQSITLTNENESLLQIKGDRLETETISMELEEIYLSIEKEFQEKNNEYNLINYGEISIGKKYDPSYEYLFEANGYQTLLIVTVKNHTLIRITYTASNQFFDIDLEKSYSIINSIEIR